MPVLIVYGMPEMDETLLEGLIDNLCRASAEMLKIPVEQVSVFFPTDRVKRGLGEELVCLVEFLFEKPERTPVLRGFLAQAIARELCSFAHVRLPQCQLIEVKVGRFNQDTDGFATLNPRSTVV